MDYTGFNFDIKQLRSFYILCKEKSFTKASQDLALSQSTISHQINQLEKKLGVNLIIRSSRDFSLTREGILLNDFCQKFFQDMDKLLNDMSDSASDGSAHIGASTIPASYIIPHTIAQIYKDHPGFFYRISSGDSREIIEKVKSNIFNMAIVGKKIAHQSLKYHKVFDDKIVLIGPEIKKIISLKDIPSIPLIIREKGSGTGDIVEKSLQEQNIYLSQCSIKFSSSSTISIIEAVKAGIGYAFISNRALSTCYSKNLKTYPVKGLNITRDFYLVHQKNKKFSKGEEIFIDYIRNKVKKT